MTQLSFGKGLRIGLKPFKDVPLGETREADGKVWRRIVNGWEYVADASRPEPEPEPSKPDAPPPVRRRGRPRKQKATPHV